mgnify:CR=1 FL=1
MVFKETYDGDQKMNLRSNDGKKKFGIKNAMQNPSELYSVFHTYSTFLANAILPENQKNYYIAITCDEYGTMFFEIKEVKGE